MKQHSKRPFRRSVTESGYLLPVVIALAIGISTISMAALQTVAWNSSTLSNQYYESLAREAAKAGITAAVGCINSGASAWSDATPLKPDTDCSGSNKATQQPTVYSTDTVESTYTVKALQNPYSNTTRVIQADAKAVIKGPAGIIAKTFPATVKALVTIPPASTTAADGGEISVGSYHACALAEGWVYCWGSNGNGRLGTGLNLIGGQSATPLAVANGPVPAQPAIPKVPNPCGGFLQAACQFGGAPAVGAQPANPMAGKTVTKISAGDSHTCAVADGKAYCWGSNDSGQLGNRSTVDSSVPVEVDTLATDYTPPPIPPSPCGGFLQPKCTPVAQPTQSKSAIAGKTIVDISAGSNFTCALTSEGNAACWGNNDSGQLGTNDTTSAAYPRSVYKSDFIPGTPAVTHIPSPCGGFLQPKCTPVVDKPAVPDAPATVLWGKSVKYLGRVNSGATMCVTDTNDKAYCWGDNSYGQLGDKEYTATRSVTASSSCSPSSSYPATPSAPAPGFPDSPQPVAVNTSEKFEILITGNNQSTGKTTTTSATPQRMFKFGGAPPVLKSVGHSRTVCGSDSSSGGGGGGGGNNKYITKTTATYSFTSTPMQLLYNDPAGTTLNKKPLGIVAGSAGNGLFCATTGSDLYCDPHDTSTKEGETGNGTVVTCTNNWLLGEKCTPTIPATPQSVKVSGALAGQLPITDMDSSIGGFTCVIASGKVFCWGVGNYGQLGNGATNNAFEPVAAPLPGGVGSGSGGTDVGSSVTSILYF